MVMDNGSDTQEWEETQDGATAGPRDGCSDTMYIACSTGSLFVPLPADLATANISDNSMHESITALLPERLCIVGDEGYDDHELCDFGRYRGHLVFPLQRYEHTTDNNRLALLQFYNSEYGQYVYSQRSNKR